MGFSVCKLSIFSLNFTLFLLSYFNRCYKTLSSFIDTCFTSIDFNYFNSGQRPAAIVTPIEGTTRDVLQVTLNIGGYPLVLSDTAGLRSDTKDIIEKEGINRALDLVKKSDLILLVIDVQRYEKWITQNTDKHFEDYLKEYIKNLNITGLLNNENSAKLFAKECLVVINKTDLTNISNLKINNTNVIKISCKTEEGVADFVNNITGKLKKL